MFARAIVIDSGYAQAFAGVADCSSFLYMYFEASEDNLKEAVTASRRAVELDPESAEAHASRGLAESLNKNYDAAEKEFELSLRLNPKLFEADYFYARSCWAQAKMEQAGTLFQKASRLNPADYQSLMSLGNCLQATGRPEEARQVFADALRVAERNLELYPEDVRALYLGAGALSQVGDRERSLEWADARLGYRFRRKHHSVQRRLHLCTSRRKRQIFGLSRKSRPQWLRS
jgi:adenylate cyclase